LAIGHLVPPQAKTVPAECIRQEHFRASLEVGAMNVEYAVGMVQVGLLETFLEGNPALVQLGAHGAIHDQDSTPESFGEVWKGGRSRHHRKAIMPTMPSDALDFDRVWLPLLYLYGVGSLFFFGGLFAVLKSGSLDLKRRAHRHWLVVLLFGLVWYMGLHLAATLAALPSA